MSEQVSIGIAPQSKKVSFSQLQHAAQVVSTQLQRDVGPAWGITAIIQAFKTIKTIPTGWIIGTVVDYLPPGLLGLHGEGELFVKSTAPLIPLLSHESVETVVDPMLNRTFRIHLGGKAVQALAEVCDMVNGRLYKDAHGNKVADFATPAWFSDTPAAGGVYDHARFLQHPKQFLSGGYLAVLPEGTSTWMEWDGHSLRRPSAVAAVASGPEAMAVQRETIMRTEGDEQDAA